MVKLMGKSPKKLAPRKGITLIFGAAGTGKTYEVCKAPWSFFIDTEGGARNSQYRDLLIKGGGAYLGPEDGSNDIEFVVGQIKALATTKHKFKTLVIDSFSKLFNTRVWNRQEEMEVLGENTASTFGREKKPAIAACQQMVKWFDRLDMGVLLTCHEAKDWITNGLKFDGWQKLDYELDLVIRVMKTGIPAKAEVIKSRYTQFQTGAIFTWNYDTYADMYGRAILDAEVKTAKPATPEEISYAMQLAGATRQPIEERVKWFEKAGVNDWAEMDGETICKCTSALQGRLPTEKKDGK